MPSWTEVQRLEAALRAPRKAYIPVADTQVITRPGWMQLLTPSMADGGLNEVSFSRLDPADAEAVIDTTLEQYRRLGIRFRWTLGPDARPLDLAERLASRGLQCTPGYAVARPLDPPVDHDPAITVKPVDARNLDELTGLIAVGWEVHPASVHAYHRACLLDPAQRQPMFVAYLDGQPVGAAAYFALERSAYLRGGVVLPSARGRGVYRALVAARIEHARRRRLSLVTSQAHADSSYPILQHLGFETVCSLSMFGP